MLSSIFLPRQLLLLNRTICIPFLFFTFVDFVFSSLRNRAATSSSFINSLSSSSLIRLVVCFLVVSYCDCLSLSSSSEMVRSFWLQAIFWMRYLYFLIREKVHLCWSTCICSECSQISGWCWPFSCWSRTRTPLPSALKHPDIPSCVIEISLLTRGFS